MDTGVLGALAGVAGKAMRKAAGMALDQPLKDTVSSLLICSCRLPEDPITEDDMYISSMRVLALVMRYETGAYVMKLPAFGLHMCRTSLATSILCCTCIMSRQRQRTRNRLSQLTS